MEKYYSIFKEKDMGKSVPTLVCVKQVKQEESEEWDESMPLPGDIIEGVAEDDVDELFVSAKAKSELSTQLGKISQRVEALWVKIRRGDNILKLHVRVVQKSGSMLQKKFTFRADRDNRHVAILGDLTSEQCTELQEMSRRVVHVDYRGFSKKRVKYDWRMKMDTYLPDQRCTAVSSILFVPLQDELSIDATTARCMAWFSVAVSSGVPLVFVNIQTEQILTSDSSLKERSNSTVKEISWGSQQSKTTTMQVVQGIRLWFLPGISEVLIEMIPEPGEPRFGMDIKRTDEGFICVYFVTGGSAADRAGLGQLYDEANATGHLLVISRLEGKTMLPSSASCDGRLHCCDHNEIRDTLATAMYRMDGIQVHIMIWPNRTRPPTTRAIDAVALHPPN